MKPGVRSLISPSEWRYSSIENIPGRVVTRLRELAEAEISKVEGDVAWYVLDTYGQWQLIERQLNDRLADLGIEPAEYVIDDSSVPAVVCMVKLWQAFREARTWFEFGGPELWTDKVQFGLNDIRRFFTVWAERESEARRRAAIAGKGSVARGDKKSDWKAEAIELFDPGPDSGSKAHRSRIIRKRAIEAGFRDAEKLPTRLDKDLD